MALATFLKATQGDENILPNFKVKEFACRDGSNTILHDTMLTWGLQEGRNYFRAAYHINSGYRTLSYNRTLKNSSDTSQHIKGKAADFTVKGRTPKEVYDYYDKWWQGGLGLYISDGFVHLDTGPKRRWIIK